MGVRGDTPDQKNRNLEPHKTKSTRVDNHARQLRYFVSRGTVPEGLMSKLVGISEYDKKTALTTRVGILLVDSFDVMLSKNK